MLNTPNHITHEDRVKTKEAIAYNKYIHGPTACSNERAALIEKETIAAVRKLCEHPELEDAITALNAYGIESISALIFELHDKHCELQSIQPNTKISQKTPQSI